MTSLADMVVEEVPQDRRVQAFSYLFEQASLQLDNDEPTAIVDDVSTSSSGSSRLFWARRCDEILAVGYLARPAGGLAQLNAPVTGQTRSEAVTVPVSRLMLQSLLKSEHVQIVQALAPLERNAWSETLALLGFREVAVVDVVSALPDSLPFATDLQFSRVAGANRLQLEQVVSATWEDSRDCVDLVDRRSAKQVLAEYASRCGDDLRHWYIIRVGDRDVGCLIMDGARDNTTLDIIYWGIVPAERGIGLGGQTLRVARRLAAAEGCVVTAVVDRQNNPAVSAYRTAGFVVFGSQRLYVLSQD